MNETNAFVDQLDFFDIMSRTYPMDSTTAQRPRYRLLLGDAQNFDDSYLSQTEVEDIKASRRERAEGRTHKFSKVDEALAWLHSDQC
jgi:hypothetical protein